MKAFVREDTVSQEVKLEDVPLPEIQADEMRIKVKAFGVGIHDRYYIPTDAKFPYVIGSEGAGIISEIGKEVKKFGVGDRVIFTSTLLPQGGSWAEYAVAKQDLAIALPDNLTFAQGAAIPIAGKTTLECIRELNLNKGDSLFIAGASGAIGTFVIQLYAAKGIHISASASAKNQDYMKSLGARKTVDYNAPDWIKKVKEWSNGGVTAALAIQPKTGLESMQVVKDGGKLITVSGYNTSIQPQRAITVRQLGHQKETYPKLAELVKSISKDEIEVIIEKEYPFKDALEALKKTETRRARGKVIVNVNG